MKMLELYYPIIQLLLTKKPVEFFLSCFLNLSALWNLCCSGNWCKHWFLSTRRDRHFKGNWLARIDVFPCTEYFVVSYLQQKTMDQLANLPGAIHSGYEWGCRLGSELQWVTRCHWQFGENWSQNQQLHCLVCKYMRRKWTRRINLWLRN